MTSSTSPLTIALLWHSTSSDNLGVGALTLAQFELLSRAADSCGRKVRFFIIGTKGNTPYEITDYAVSGNAEFALRAFKRGDFSAIRMLRGADIVFDIGEGDSFADIYGLKRLSIQVFAKLLARILGKPLIMSPQTIGPFRSPLGRMLGRFGLMLASRVYARDGLSLECVSELGFSSRCHEVIDVAFALPYKRSNADSSVIRIGINVSGLLFSGGYDGRNRLGLSVDYPRLMEDCCQYFLEKDGAEVYLVPHVISDAIPVENDVRACERLKAKFPELRIAPRFASPCEAKSFISGMDFFTGARMHACIAAYSSGVPVVPMAYSRKFQGLFGALGYGRVIDCLTSNNEDAMKALELAFENRALLAGEVAVGNRRAEERVDVYVNEVSMVLDEIS